MEKEIWGLFDRNRQKTDRTCFRGEQIPKGYYHTVIHVAVFSSQGDMLIQKRRPEKEVFPGLWDVTVGGSAVLWETGGEAAMRELGEEVGIRAPELAELPPVWTVSFSCGFDDYFILRKDVDPESLLLQEEEVEAVRYASRDEILSMIEDGAFIPYHPALIELLFSMNERGSVYRWK